MSGEDDTVIRPYRACDREAVRRVCFETGYMGEPIAWQWRDAESFADLFTSYYTDHEPESATVVEINGRVVGYLLGCRDTRHAGNPVAPLGRHIVKRGLLFRPGTAGVLWRSFRDIAGDAARRDLPPASDYDPRWPAHLHIDFLPEARGRGLGRTMMTGWLEALRSDDVAGCHLGTWAENHGAISFFEAMGFRRSGGMQPMPGMRSPSGGRHHTQTMTIEFT